MTDPSAAIVPVIPVVPGEILTGPEPVELFAGVTIATVEVRNTGDRPIQVGSHYHFAESNLALAFDRDTARGHRLAIPAGTSIRFEPGIERTVDLVPLGGRRIVTGLRGSVAGPLDGPTDPDPDDSTDGSDSTGGSDAFDGDEG